MKRELCVRIGRRGGWRGRLLKDLVGRMGGEQ